MASIQGFDGILQYMWKVNIWFVQIIGTTRLSSRAQHSDGLVCLDIMASWYWNPFRITGPLWGESSSHWWIPLKIDQYAKLSLFALRLSGLPHHDDTTWKCFPQYWLFERQTQQLIIDSTHKRPLMRSFAVLLLLASIGCWIFELPVV